MVGGGNLCFVKIEFGEIDGFYMLIMLTFIGNI